MKILKQLIKLHKLLFAAAVLFTALSILLSLCWNKFLAGVLDSLNQAAILDSGFRVDILSGILVTGMMIVCLHTISEYLSSYLSSCTCETFAHEMRMGYAGYYLQSDIRKLSRLNVGEEQSAMQNELKEISDYLNGNLFPLMKQFSLFAATVVFLLCQSPGLTLFSVIPVLPLILYCSFSSRKIKDATDQCQNSRKKMNGLADMILELFPVIQVYKVQQLIKDAVKENLSEWEKTAVRRERISARLMSLSGVLSFVPLLLLLGIGGHMVIKGEISMGTFYIFINLSRNVSGFLQNMPGIYANFRRFGAAVGRLEEKLVWKKE